MPNTVNSYIETDLGNVSPNPRGEYNATYDYEYLDLIYYKGGSYLCLAPLGETIKNIPPIEGQTTTNWQCVAIPGDLTPEYISMYNEVVKDYNETNTNTADVAQMKDVTYASMTAAQESESKASTSETNARNSEVNAKQSMDKAKEYSDEAIRVNNDTQSLVTGFDEHVATAISNAEASISESTDNAKEEIIAQKSSSLNEFRTDAETVMTNEKNVAVTEIHNIVDDFDIATDAKEQEVIALANEKIDVMTALKDDTINAKNAAETASTTAFEKANEATTSADNAKSSENAVAEMKISIEQSQSDVQIKQIRVSSDAQQVSSDKSDILIMKSSIEDTAEKVDIDVQNGLQQILDSKDDSLSDIQNKKNEVIADIEQYGALQVSNEEPTSENVDLWINPDNEEEYSVPEIKDGEVNASDTWSSEKIFGEISELKSDLAQKELVSRLGYDDYYKKDDVLVGVGRVNSLNGVIYGDTHFQYVSIPIKENDTITFGTNVTSFGQVNASVIVGYAFYNSNGDYISGENPKYVTSFSIVAPKNSAYFRISSNKDYWDELSSNFYIEFASTNYKKADNALLEQIGDVYDLKGIKNAFAIYDLTEVDLSSANSGFYIKGTNNIRNQSGWKCIELSLTDCDIIRFVLHANSNDIVNPVQFVNSQGTIIGYGVDLYDGEKDLDITMKIPSEATKAYISYRDSYPHHIYVGNTSYNYENIDKRIDDKTKAQTDLSSKTWNAVGDSITQQERYMRDVKKILGISYTNCGLASSTLAINNTYLQNQSIVERICGLNGNTAYSNADIWTVMGGLNDCLYRSKLGELSASGSDFDLTTVYGALQKICEHILGLSDKPNLILLTPTHSNRDTWSKESYGITMAEIRQAIIDVGEFYSIPILDMWAECGISSYNLQRSENPTTSDGVHPNDLGSEIMSPCVAEKIYKSFYWSEKLD